MTNEFDVEAFRFVARVSEKEIKKGEIPKKGMPEDRSLDVFLFPEINKLGHVSFEVAGCPQM